MNRKITSLIKLIKNKYICFLHTNVSMHRSVLIKKGVVLKAWDNGGITVGAGVTMCENSYIEATASGKVLLEGENFINRNCQISAREEILIEKNVTIGPATVIYDHDHKFRKGDNNSQFVTSKVVIKKNAWIGSGCIILKGVTIGENSIVAAGTIVTKDVPPNSIARNNVELIISPK